MLTNFFSKSKPITFLVTLFLFLGLFFTTIFSGKIVAGYFEKFFLLLLMLVIIIFIKTKNKLSFYNSYVFLICVLLLGLFPSAMETKSIFYSNLSLLLFLRKIYSLQATTQTFKKLFDAGLWLGISFILEPFSLLFGVLLYLSIYLYQHVTFQKISIPIIGFFTPVLLFFTYCLWFDEMSSFFNLLEWHTSYDLNIYLQSNYLLPISLISLCSLIAVFVKTPVALRVKNIFRKSWILILFHFICALILLISIKNKNGNEFLYIFFPVSIIIANLIEIYEKKWFSDILIIILIISSFSVSFFNFL